MTITCFSMCNKYRYFLERSWSSGNGHLCWILLNPSTADAQVDDPTIRRCIRFAQRWGYAGMQVVNLFAYRSTDPGQLRAVGDPVGPDNNRFILQAARECDKVVLGWGNHGSLHARDASVLDLLHRAEIIPHVLGLTRRNAPKHPLYLKGDITPYPFPK
ncbi:MAG: DUF1643 domain-containing protein [Proteobacteria bacterium]|nr:DUF1643 domain-containing protein [Pseudodesulfovibrio aespoeensis]MBU4378735.1 DUF1643 domain-containing protein [Pseudomonadota bacterium]MBU4473656.1 DUF1643 domain-containing protein [Pseudomonadota bacterium]MBU4517486.1 DUF1643 domain-containing protein [Pseudomonadota bacterium]MBU4523781.1 DUF1643 domain-containing protein [Pseudomonadota bacterium]MBU4559753.1 DUF1643 domain-containing protein [Pseudomonadota bacterium]